MLCRAGRKDAHVDQIVMCCLLSGGDVVLDRSHCSPKETAKHSPERGRES